MQRLIREKFSSHTIIAVAHKLDTILDFDKVAMLDGGRLIEFEDPYVLLNQHSAFSQLYSSAVAEQQTEEVQVKDDTTSASGTSPPKSLPSSSMAGSSSVSVR
jgi:ATP-binding cassette, subfamily C (CFTR/MRP), member 1